MFLNTKGMLNIIRMKVPSGKASTRLALLSDLVTNPLCSLRRVSLLCLSKSKQYKDSIYNFYSAHFGIALK